MFTKKQMIGVYVILIIGSLISLKLFHIDYMVNYSSESFKSFCNINSTFNCDAVAASKYSYFLGVPIALWGLLGNIFLLLFVPIALKKESLKGILKNIFLTIFGIFCLGCLCLIFISFTFISSFCLLCMAFWTLCFISFIYFWTITKEERKDNFFHKLFEGLKREKFLILSGLLLFFIANYGVMALMMKRCSGPQVKECQHFNEYTNRSYLGDDSAFLEISVFTDFECPYCKKVNAHIERLAQKHRKTVRMVRKEFPLDHHCNPLLKKPMHLYACMASYFSKCAGKQGKYWEYHNLLYKTTEDFSKELFISLAKESSLDIDKLLKCVESDEIKNIVKNDIEEGMALKLQGTPSFKIFGEVLPGILMEKDIKEHLENYPFVRGEMVKNAYEQGVSLNMKIFDLRTGEAYREKHLKGAELLSFNEDELQNQKFDFEDKDILLYGDNNELLLKAFEFFKRREMNVRILKEGINFFELNFPQYLE